MYFNLSNPLKIFSFFFLGLNVYFFQGFAQLRSLEFVLPSNFLLSRVDNGEGGTEKYFIQNETAWIFNAEQTYVAEWSSSHIQAGSTSDQSVSR